jgi:hypothetical protein
VLPAECQRGPAGQLVDLGCKPRGLGFLTGRGLTGMTPTNVSSPPSQTSRSRCNARPNAMTSSRRFRYRFASAILAVSLAERLDATLLVRF